MLYEFEKCEAALSSGKRCQNAWTESVGNPGAIMPYKVCRVHRLQGERSIARSGELPRVWNDFWKLWRR